MNREFPLGGLPLPANVMAIDIRVLTISWCEGSPTTRMVIGDAQASMLCDALVKLHHSPGINPHIKDRDPSTSRIYMIKSAPLVNNGPYWWTGESLGVNGVDDGAEIIDASISNAKTLWADYEWINREFGDH